MTSFIVASFMWLLVAVLSLRARYRTDNTILWAAIAIAVSFTTNIDWLYLATSKTLPWSNGLDLAANGLLMVGIYYLSSAIGRGATGLGAAGEFKAQWIRTAAVCAVTLMVIFFSQINASVPSTEFMLTYGDQLPAALYSMTQYTYIFAVMTGVLIVCVRNVPRMRHRRFRAGFSFLAAGSTVALALCAVVIWMDVAHLAGRVHLMTSLGLIYSLLYSLAIVLLCIGLGIPPIGRLWLSLRLSQRIGKLEPQISSIWSRTAAKHGSVSLVAKSVDGSWPDASSNSDPIDRLHRMVIEIHDWLNLNRDQLDEDDRHVLLAAEDLCMQPGSQR